MSKARDLADSVAAGSVLADGVVSLSEVGGGTNNGVVYVNGTGTTTSGSGLTYNGTTFGVTGNTTLGDASTDTVTVNGYMGVGGAASSSYGINLTPSALTGTTQRGLSSSIIGTSAATSSITGVRGSVETAAASFTVSDAIALLAAGGGKGAGSTITNQHGVYVADQTYGTNNYGITSVVSSGTNKWNIYASGTAANYFAGKVGIGVTPAEKLDVKAAIRLTSSSGAGWYGEIGQYNTTSASVTGTPSELRLSSYNTFGAPYSSTMSFWTGAGTTKERLIFKENEAVFNDPGNDYDFRIESGANTHRLFVDAGNDAVLFGSSTPVSTQYIGDSTASSFQSKLQVLGDGVGKASFTITRTGGTNPPYLFLNAGDTSNPVLDQNALGRIIFSGNDGTNYRNAAEIQAIVAGTPAPGAMPGKLIFATSAASTATPIERMSLAASETAFNDTGANTDFRVESDTNTHMLFVDAGANSVGVGGTTAPDGIFDIAYLYSTTQDAYKGGFFFTGSTTTINPNRRLKFDHSSTSTFTVSATAGDSTTATSDCLLSVSAVDVRVDQGRLKDQNGIKYLYNSLNNYGGNMPLTHKVGFLGTTGDPSPAYVLLCTAYTSTLKAKEVVFGRVYRSRGDASAGNVTCVYEFEAASAYNYNQGRGFTMGNNTGEIRTCVYNGVTYVALYIANTSATAVSCDLWYASNTGTLFEPIMVDDSAVTSPTTLAALTVL